MSDRLTLERGIELAKEVVGERPEFVYERERVGDVLLGCTYVRDGQPSCLVGCVMYRAGVPIEELEGIEGESAYGLLDFLIDYAPENQIEKRLLEKFLVDIQYKQDSGSPWGEALEYAMACSAMRQKEGS